MKTATGAEVTNAAQGQALMDTARGITDPHGAFQNWRLVNALFMSEAAADVRERDLAYKLFVKSYLVQQGWGPR